MVLEDSREEVCFKTGIAGFTLTMMFFALDELLTANY